MIFLAPGVLRGVSFYIWLFKEYHHIFLCYSPFVLILESWRGWHFIIVSIFKFCSRLLEIQIFGDYYIKNLMHHLVVLSLPQIDSTLQFLFNFFPVPHFFLLDNHKCFLCVKGIPWGIVTYFLLGINCGLLFNLLYTLMYYILSIITGFVEFGNK